MPHHQSSPAEEPQFRAPEKTYPRFSLYEDLWLTSLLTGLQRHPTAQIMQLQRVEASPHRPRTRSRTSALHSARLRFPQAAVFAENKKTQCASRSPTLARLAPAAAAATEGVCLLTSRFPAAAPGAALSPTRDPRGGGSGDRRVPVSIPIPRKPERAFPSSRKTARAAAVQEQHPQLIPSPASHPSLVSRAVPARFLSLRHSLALDRCCRQGSLRHSSFCL